MAGRAKGWTLHRDPRTGVHTVRFRVAGRRVHRSTRREDPREAQIEAARIYAETLSGRRGPQAIRGELDVMLSRWLAAVAPEVAPGTAELFETYVAAHWLPFFRDASALTAAGVADYTRHRLRHVTRSTVGKELSALRRFFRWLEEGGVEVPEVPRLSTRVTGKRAQKRMLVELTAGEMEKILAKLPKSTTKGNAARAFFRVMWETGLRRSTIDRLSVPEHFMSGRAELRITAEIDKARYERTIPITAAARAELELVAPKRGLIFGAVDYRHTLRKAAARAGLSGDRVEHLGYHAFRHARTTALLDAGASLTGTAYLVGHRHVTTTNLYAHAKRRAAEEALGAIRDTGRDTARKSRRDTKKAR